MNKFIYLFFMLAASTSLQAQIDTSLLKSIPKDSAKSKLNMDAVYNRPMLTTRNSPISIGGYMEANWQHQNTDGISEGHQFQFRRFTIFMASSIGRRIKFLSELEFEDGTKEIALEFAAVDIEFNPFLNLRTGIILNPIGAFNQNHDGPKWEFTDRPISSTQMLPATWSNAGFGLFGKKYKGKWMLGYEAYLTNGFDNSIIDNESNRTSLAAAKNNPFRFEESGSGKPLTTAKIAARHSKWGELGLSYMGGIYNTFQVDGIAVDNKRRCDVLALDYNVNITQTHTSIILEWAQVKINIPATYTQQYGRLQRGGYLDIIQPIITGNILGWNRAVLNVACRLEYVDWNVGAFTSTQGNIGDELYSIMPAISFRPVTETVIRFNYRLQTQKDLLGNPPVKTGIFNVGLSTYF